MVEHRVVVAVILRVAREARRAIKAEVEAEAVRVQEVEAVVVATVPLPLAATMGKPRGEEVRAPRPQPRSRNEKPLRITQGKRSRPFPRLSVAEFITCMLMKRVCLGARIIAKARSALPSI